MLCKFCNLEKKLVKAHIIPKAFFTGVNKTKIPSKLITSNPSIPPKKSRVGIYDMKLVCAGCEDKFKEFDDYAIKFLKQDFNKLKELKDKNVLLGYIAKDINYKFLKLFFISLIWRASASLHEYYNQVQASPYHDSLKHHIQQKEPGDIHDFSVMIWRFDADPEIIGMICPWKQRIENILCYHFVFYGFHCVIKVASHNFPVSSHCLLLSPNRDLFIGIRDYKNTGYHDFILKIARAQKFKIF